VTELYVATVSFTEYLSLELYYYYYATFRRIDSGPPPPLSSATLDKLFIHTCLCH